MAVEWQGDNTWEDLDTGDFWEITETDDGKRIFFKNGEEIAESSFYHQTQGLVIQVATIGNTRFTKYIGPNGKLHRDDGPAYIEDQLVTGTRREWWYSNGNFHSDDGPAYRYLNVQGKVEFEEWRRNGRLHRIGGPAARNVLTGKDHWYVDGKRHRIGGPAIQSSTGEKRYFFEGQELTEVSYRELMETLPYDYKVADGVEYYYMKDSDTLHREGGPAVRYQNGDEEWYFKDLLHRADGPALIEDDDQYWYHMGRQHRMDGPAVIYADGSYEYFLNDRLHRTNGPAVYHNYTEGDRYEYWLNGKMHRLDGPAVIDESENGENEYYVFGERVPEEEFLSGSVKINDGRGTTWVQTNHGSPSIRYHRENGPAVIWNNGSEYWYREGKIHREDGPAIKHSDGTVEYALNGVVMSEEDFVKAGGSLKPKLNSGSVQEETIGGAGIGWAAGAAVAISFLGALSKSKRQRSRRAGKQEIQKQVVEEATVSTNRR